MALRKEPLTFGEFYHIYNRGNSKQNIFLDDADRERFVKLLYLCNSSQHIRFREDIINRKIDAWDYDKGKPIVSIGAWVLMKNHFHIYLTPRRLLGGNEKVKESSISVFVRKLGTAYSMYFIQPMISRETRRYKKGSVGIRCLTPIFRGERML